MHQHAELARCVPRRKNFFKHLVDWKSCSTFALATQKNGASEVSEPYEWWSSFVGERDAQVLLVSVTLALLLFI